MAEGEDRTAPGQRAQGGEAGDRQGGYTSDEMAITALVCRYPELIDAGDFEGIAELFSSATLGEGDEAMPGGPPLLEMLTRMVRTYGGRTLTRHLVTNLVVEVGPDGRTASARSCITVLQADPPSFPLQIIATNRHHDRFEKRGGEWVFVRRSNITDLIGDMSHHINQPAG